MSKRLIERAAPGVRALHPYQPGKPISELERELGLKEIIKLASNENPLGASPAALRAIAAATNDVWLYPDGGGFALKRALTELHQVEMSQITLGNGSSDLLEFAVRVFVQPGDEVLYSQHSFAIYPIVTQAVSGLGVEAPAKDWGYDLAALRRCITDKTRVIFIANPNNPTGTWVDGEGLEAFVRDVPKDILIVLDEAYYDYARHLIGDARYPDTVSWLKRYSNVVITRTFSKSYGLAGLRVGYAISSPEVADLLNRVRPPFNVNLLALVAAEAAVSDTEHLHKTVELNAAGLHQLMQAFDDMGLSYIPSVGNFICVDVGREAAPLYQLLLKQGVIVRPVANYAMPKHLRVSVGLPEQNAKFIAALKKSL